jgi:hypothetical protein
MDAKLQELQAEIAAAIKNLTPEELERRAPGKWSIGEILEHLYLTFTATTKGFERCLKASKPLATGPTWKQRVARAVTVDFGYMPGGREAPSFVRPRGLSNDVVAAEIGAKLAAMDEAISACEVRHGEQSKLLDHGIIGALTGPQWRKFHCVHGRHHLKQIAELKKR